MIMLSTNKDFKEGNHYFLHERIFYGIFSLNKAKKVKKQIQNGQLITSDQF